MIDVISVDTKNQTELIDITEKIKKAVRQSDMKEGLCTLFVPHTTAAVTINENADPAVVRDILKEMNKVIPFEDHYSHMEGNSAAHIKASLFGFSETIFVKDGNLMLGTWQGIYFCEFDGPRRRKLFLQLTG